MSADEKRRHLGRGLSALLGGDNEDYAELDRVRVSKVVPIELLQPAHFQPRHNILEANLDELARSVAEQGILQPILVRRMPTEPNAYQIIAGERRWRAAQRARLHEVPVIIKELSDQEAMEIALVENLQRQDLSPLEEAMGFQRLMDEFGNTQEELARRVGKSRSHVANTLRLLGLPDAVKELMDRGALTAGHGRALLGARNPEALARRAANEELNVRQVEHAVRAQANGKGSKSRRAAEKDADTAALEKELGAALGLAVEVRYRDGRGALVLHYQTLEQLDDILHRLRQNPTG